MTDFKLGDFVWAKMTGYPYWPGKIAEPADDIKKPNKKFEMHFIRFYGTGDYAWTKTDLVHSYSENKEKYSSASKKVGFIQAVKQIDHAFERRGKGLPDTSDEESEAESDASDDEPLSKRAKIDTTPKQVKTKPRKPKKVVLPTREERRSLDMSNDEYHNSPDTTADADSTTSFISKEIIPTDKKIGFLGLGIMGLPMAMNLLQNGHNVTVWNRKSARCKLLVDAGAKEGLSPCDVVQQCDITFSCVSDSDAVKDIVMDNNGVLQGLSAGKGYVEMSTVDQNTTKEIAEAITAKGGRFLEAPVCGSKKTAESGQLVILAAGDRSLYMDGHSCFETMGKKTLFLGELGSGANTKIIVNMLMGTFMASLAEGLSLAEKAGLDQYTLLDVLNMSDIACPLVKNKGFAILEGHFPAMFPIRHQQKDLKLAMNMGDSLEQPLSVTASANELYKRTKAMGFDDRDMSCVYRAVNT